VLTFYTVASDIMQKTGNKYADATASMFIAIPNFLSIGFSPLFGRLVDQKGSALTFCLIASIMMIVAHVLFLILAYEWVLFSPAPVMVWLGLSYSLGAASLWPTLGCIVDKKVLGTAYGCMTAVQNLGLAVFPMIIGFLQEANGINGTKLQYTLPILIFIGCEVTAGLLTLVLIGVDKAKHGGVMNASAEQRENMKLNIVETIVDPPVDVVWDGKTPTKNERENTNDSTPQSSRQQQSPDPADLSRSPFLGVHVNRSADDGS